MKGKEGFQKGEGGRHKGSLNKKTLAKLERRAIFEEEVSKMWLETIKKMRPEYIGDQFMGKAPDILKITEALKKDPSQRAKEAAEIINELIRTGKIH